MENKLIEILIAIAAITLISLSPESKQQILWVAHCEILNSDSTEFSYVVKVIQTETDNRLEAQRL